MTDLWKCLEDNHMVDRGNGTIARFGACRIEWRAEHGDIKAFDEELHEWAEEYHKRNTTI